MRNEVSLDTVCFATIEEVSANAAEIVIEDKYDFVVVYNAGYGSVMHARGPESSEALAELREISELFCRGEKHCFTSLTNTKNNDIIKN